VPSSQVKIFGERNTGTNALKELIERNSNSVCLPGTETELHPLLGRIVNSGFLRPSASEAVRDFIYSRPSPRHAWKHCTTNFEDVSTFEGVLVLLAVRHPASWLLSLFRHPYHRSGPSVSDVATFMQTPWKTARRERLGGRSFLPLELYRTKLDRNLKFAQRLSAAGIENQFIRHEDLILEQPAVFRSISEHLKEPRRDLQPLESATKHSGRTIEEIRTYYRNEEWRTELEGLETEINQAIDWEHVARFGYDPL
jgi:hypothetical protein